MKRRQLLAASGALLAATAAGCLDGGSNHPGTGLGDDEDGDDDGSIENGDIGPGTDERLYEQCGREIVPYEDLPDPVKEEVDAALEDPPYGASRVHLGDAMDVNASYLSIEGDFYDARIEFEDGRERLDLERVEPTAYPSGRTVTITPESLDGSSIHVEIVAETEGDTLVDATISGDAGPTTVGRLHRAGTHPLAVTIDPADDGDETGDDGETESGGGDDETGDTETHEETVPITESRFSIEIHIDPEGVAVGGTVADLPECRWQD